MTVLHVWQSPFTNTDGKHSPLILPLSRTVPQSSGASHSSASPLPHSLHAPSRTSDLSLFISAILHSWNEHTVILARSEPVCTPSSGDNSTLAVSPSAHLMLTRQKSVLLLSGSAPDEMLCSACLLLRFSLESSSLTFRVRGCGSVLERVFHHV